MDDAGGAGKLAWAISTDWESSRRVDLSPGHRGRSNQPDAPPLCWSRSPCGSGTNGGQPLICFRRAIVGFSRSSGRITRQSRTGDGPHRLGRFQEAVRIVIKQGPVQSDRKTTSGRLNNSANALQQAWKIHQAVDSYRQRRVFLRPDFPGGAHFKRRQCVRGQTSNQARRSKSISWRFGFARHSLTRFTTGLSWRRYRARLSGCGV